MEIKYLGHSSFLIRTKTARIVTDPFDAKMVGLKFPRVEADIVTISHHHKDHDGGLSQIDGNPTVFDWPGQFEKNGVRIWGYRTFHDKAEGKERGENIMYKFEADGISVLHCGDLGLVPENAFLDEVGDVDVIFVPVGGYYTIDAQEAIEVVKKAEPSIVIPMHYGYKDGGIKELAPLSDFLKKIGVENAVPQDKLIVKPEELEEEMKVVVLKS